MRGPRLDLACLLALVLLTTHAPPGHAQDTAIAIVVGERAKVRTLSRDDLAALFLGMAAGRDTLAGVLPADSDDPAVREAFYQMLLGRSRNQMRAYWSRMVFTGQGRPPPLLSADELASRLGTEPNWLGYVRLGQRPAGTRTLFVLP